MLKEQVWVIKDIEDCEQIAGHMYRMGLMTFLLTEENNPTKLDRYRCLEIVLIHDLAECIVGDLTPHCGTPQWSSVFYFRRYSPEVKDRRQDEAMKTSFELTGFAVVRIYKKYKNQTSPEAKFAKDLDRYDMILQAFEYERRQKKTKKLEELFTATYWKLTY